MLQKQNRTTSRHRSFKSPRDSFRISLPSVGRRFLAVLTRTTSSIGQEVPHANLTSPSVCSLRTSAQSSKFSVCAVYLDRSDGRLTSFRSHLLRSMRLSQPPRYLQRSPVNFRLFDPRSSACSRYSSRIGCLLES